MMSWYEVLKDFKTDWKDPDTGESKPNVLGVFNPDSQEVTINLGANALKNISEEEAMTLITETLIHEYTHMGFNQIAGTVDKYYSELLTLLNKFHGDVLDAKTPLPLPEDEIIEIIKKMVGHKILDELMATRSNLKDGPTRILIEGYHKDTSRKFAMVLNKYISSMKDKTTEILTKVSKEVGGSPSEKKQIFSYITFIHSLSMGTLQFLEGKVNNIIELFEMMYKNIAAKFSAKELQENPDLNNQYIKTLMRIVKLGRWDLLEEFWEKDV